MSSAYQIPVLRKAIRVLHAIADRSCEPTTNSLARALSIAPATSYRIIQTFATAKWLDLREDGRCEIGLGLLPIVQGLKQHELMRQEVASALAELTRVTGVTSKVSISDGDEAVTLMRANSAEPMSLAVQPGSRFHLAFGSSGAVILSERDDAEVEKVLDTAPESCWTYQSRADVRQRIAVSRKTGLAEDLGCFRPDVFGLSAPMRNREGKPIGTLTLTGLLHGRSEKQIQSWRKLLLKTAADLNRH
ncbi:MAG: hypothetical protein H8M99_02615 [Gloeobacteraceae cyanobacterium ES-bin-144]|nr:hypothetical protein [Verrucomicrobiales bacterium]